MTLKICLYIILNHYLDVYFNLFSEEEKKRIENIVKYNIKLKKITAFKIENFLDYGIPKNEINLFLLETDLFDIYCEFELNIIQIEFLTYFGSKTYQNKKNVLIKILSNKSQREFFLKENSFEYVYAVKELNTLPVFNTDLGEPVYLTPKEFCNLKIEEDNFFFQKNNISLNYLLENKIFKEMFN